MASSKWNAAGKKKKNPRGLYGQGLSDEKVPDDSEIVYIAPLALIKIMKHAGESLPFRVCGLLLGEFVDDYKIKIVDVFAMPWSLNEVAIQVFDSTNSPYTEKMMVMLKQTKREEDIIGWYLSCPYDHALLSETELYTQFAFRKVVTSRCVVISYDLIHSRRGSLEIQAYRCNGVCKDKANGGKKTDDERREQQRQTTSNIGRQVATTSMYVEREKWRYYYLVIEYPLSPAEEKMLLACFRNHNIVLPEYAKSHETREAGLKKMLELVQDCMEALEEEENETNPQPEVANFGQRDLKREVEEAADTMMKESIKEGLACAMTTKCFNKSNED